MSPKPRLHPLARVLQRLAPDALIAVIRQQPWHSMTFAGERLELSLSLCGPDAAAHLEAFGHQLPDMEFALPRMLVADIAVTDMTANARSAMLHVEALLLEE